MNHVAELLDRVLPQHAATIATLHCCHRLESAGWRRGDIHAAATPISYAVYAGALTARAAAEWAAMSCITAGYPALVHAAYLSVMLHVGDVAANAIIAASE